MYSKHSSVLTSDNIRLHSKLTSWPASDSEIMFKFFTGTACDQLNDQGDCVTVTLFQLLFDNHYVPMNSLATNFTDLYLSVTCFE